MKALNGAELGDINRKTIALSTLGINENGLFQKRSIPH